MAFAPSANATDVLRQSSIGFQPAESDHCEAQRLSISGRFRPGTPCLVQQELVRLAPELRNPEWEPVELRGSVLTKFKGSQRYHKGPLKG
jgi:hypothetical protein